MKILNEFWQNGRILSTMVEDDSGEVIIGRVWDIDGNELDVRAYETQIIREQKEYQKIRSELIEWQKKNEGEK